jgi:biopolymer transport protein ExbD
VTLPATALADMALLLVLYFLLTTTYDPDRARLDLPAAAPSSVAEIGSPCVILARDPERSSREGLRYRWYDGLSATRDMRGSEELWLEVSRVADRDPGATVVLKAESSVRWADVDEVMALLEDAGARNVLLWTRPAPGRSP